MGKIKYEDIISYDIIIQSHKFSFTATKQFLSLMEKRTGQTLFDIGSGAIFSSCRRYRYALWRIWDDSKPMVMFIGLNPSTANETEPDPTITRVISFAKSWGYGGVYMMNLFAWVTPYPKVLYACPDPLGDNDGWIENVSKRCDKVIFAWGKFKEAKDRANQVIQKFPDAEALIINKDGSPRHPLYVKGDVAPVKYANYSI